MDISFIPLQVHVFCSVQLQHMLTHRIFVVIVQQLVFSVLEQLSLVLLVRVQHISMNKVVKQHVPMDIMKILH